MFKRLKNKFLNLTLRRKFIYLIGGIVTITPTILIGMLASVYYYSGVESLFNNQVSKAVSDTVNIARLYLKQSNESVKFDLLQVEKVLERQMKVISESRELSDLLDEQVKTRGISEAMIFTREAVVAKSALSFSLIFQRIPEEIFEEIDQEKVVLLENHSKDKVMAITKLEGIHYDGLYLIIGKYIDKEIIDYLQKTQGSAQKYYYLLSGVKFTKNNLQIAFISLSVLMCFASFIISVKLASIISNPLNKLLNATTKIKEGDYSIRVPERDLNDEVSLLGKAFNQMTRTIEKQHTELNVAYRDIDERVKFIETVLREISSGVIALDARGFVTLYNNAAKELLSLDKLTGDVEVSAIIPEIEPLLSNILREPKSVFQDNFIIKRNGRTIHLFIKIGAVVIDDEISNIVISFEDITKLVAAQREAAWSDVARRIAHEIKNPLTPIQLSAERLSSKYSKQINKDDLENYQKYVSAILRNASDIHAIVSEFIQFARIPKPKLEEHEIVGIIKDVIFNQKNIFRDINFTFTSEDYYVICDKMQITQVLTNIAKNAAESIATRYGNSAGVGSIKFTIKEIDNGQIEITVEDNGNGLDEDLLLRIAEPYVTTKKTGMGLGLSIVKKILEDHESDLHLSNIENGVCVKFNLKFRRK
ncbi:sensor histidine kinase [Candidatus Bandiella euplotis]|uniref:Putative sensor histidine kinase NtrY-like n=1 Tax=Candidatus Bandiella euplotis TaxID=1664265 RepID=A0ABZ0UIW3_9RICK|nr:ATP-binding protein [Candidatus Bandiella woodruffii]WPX96026.1 Sensor histidine kinase [Candidatus Bandiella woodruffii]